MAVKSSCLIALLAAPLSLTALVSSGSSGSLVRLTTVVTNVRGEPVHGLRAADFDLSVDGAPQPIESAEFRSDGARIPRVFAVVLDEFHVPPAYGVPVRDTLLPLVDAHLREGDLAVVVKPLDSLTAIRPTSDRRAVLASIASFDARQGDYSARTVFERSYMAQAPNAMAAARAQIVTSAVRAVAATLGELPDVRPVLVLVSDGFPRQRADRSVPANLLSAVRIANRAEVPVYVFAPSSAPAADPAAPPAEGHAALRAVAVATGGDFTSGVGSFAGGMTRMIRDLDAYYVLTYRAPHSDDGRFHSVTVAARRPAVVVRARTGYVAPLAQALRVPAAGAPLSMRALRRSPLIRAWSGIVRGETGSPRVTLTWEPSAPQTGTAQPSPAAMVVTATTPDGTVLFDGNVAPVGRQPVDGTANRAEFEAPAGRILIDAKVVDAKGIVLDTESRDIDVPALRPSRATILPPAVLRASSAREFRAIVGDPLAAPVPSREFRRTERLLLRVPAYLPDGAPARVSATLLNRWRHPMRALPAMDGAAQPGVTQFDIPLAPLAPGEYSIRLTAGTAIEHVTFRVRG